MKSIFFVLIFLFIFASCGRVEPNSVDFTTSQSLLEESACKAIEDTRANGNLVRYPSYLYHCSHGLRITYAGTSTTRVRDFADKRLSERLIKVFKHLKTEFHVKHVDHLGIFNNRPPSRHTKAVAIDIAGFTLEDGQTLTLLRDWNHPTKGLLLRNIRSYFCTQFYTVLSPDYNSAHADHFHMDLGPNTYSAADDDEHGVLGCF